MCCSLHGIIYQYIIMYVYFEMATTVLGHLSMVQLHRNEDE